MSARSSAALLTVALATSLIAVPATPASAVPPNKECGRAQQKAHPLAQQPWAMQRLRPQNVWPLTRGQGVIVAVIDSGVNDEHPKLAGKVLPGNDFTATGGQCDAYFHGTFIAGLIAGRDSKESPFAGVAPDATILPLRVIQDGSKEDTTDTTPSRIADAIDMAVAQKAKVINLSLYSKPTPKLVAAIERAVKADVVLVAAAGNGRGQTDGRYYPASAPGVIAVAGVDPQDKVASSSSPGDYVDVAAPGVSIDGPALRGDLYITEEAGTSYATGFVSGLAALLRAYYKDMTAEQVAERIMKTADRPPRSKGRDDNVGYGIINPYRALTAQLDPAMAKKQPVAGGFTAPDPKDDPLWAAKTFGPWIIGGLLALAGLIGTLAYAVPRGRRRGWRPGRAGSRLSDERQPDLVED
ncbi:type VII secretion-associated serine protease mycosin [Longispora albida]|uniref:type VII secretion-associated serine protease mycosin n=1 Tax=Longispora albida TaxID=203523 RepID=UPI00037E0975|nr:type VII secretion-associated serine protease mycosin [Longispora albida]